MKTSAFAEVIIVPYFNTSHSQLERIKSAIGDKKTFVDFMETAEAHLPDTASVDLNVSEIDMPEEPIKSIGTIQLEVRWSGGSLDDDLVSWLLSRGTQWVRSALAINGAENWMGYMYSILVLHESDIPLKAELERNPALLAKLVPNLRFPGALLVPEQIRKITGPDLGTQETDCYKFSSHGGLIYDMNPSSSDYIVSRVIPLIAKLQSAQAYCEQSSIGLSKTLGKYLREGTELSLQDLGRLRASILLVLANAQQPVGFRQLNDISNRLGVIFRLNTFRTRLKDELDALDSVMERLNDARLAQFNRRMTYLALFVGAAGALAAIAVVPQIPEFIKWLSGTP